MEMLGVLKSGKQKAADAKEGSEAKDNLPTLSELLLAEKSRLEQELGELLSHDPE